MLGAIFGLIQTIVCVLENLAFSVLAVIIMGFNAIIAGLGAAVAAVIGLLPDMPNAPDMLTALGSNGSMILGWVAWLFPLGVLFTTFATAIVLWIAVQAVVIIMRWVKAVD